MIIANINSENNKIINYKNKTNMKTKRNIKQVIEKYGSKNLQYFFKTNQNVFGVTDRVFNKTKKLVELVEGLGGVQLVNVTGDCGKNNTMLLEFSNTVLIVQMYVNSNYISVGNNPYIGQYYFNTYLKVGSSHLNEVVDYIRNYFIK